MSVKIIKMLAELKHIQKVGRDNGLLSVSVNFDDFDKAVSLIEHLWEQSNATLKKSLPKKLLKNLRENAAAIEDRFDIETTTARDMAARDLGFPNYKEVRTLWRRKHPNLNDDGTPK